MKGIPGSKVKVRQLGVTSELLFIPVPEPCGDAEIALSPLVVQLLAVFVLILPPEPCVFLLDPPRQVTFSSAVLPEMLAEPVRGRNLTTTAEIIPERPFAD